MFQAIHNNNNINVFIAAFLVVTFSSMLLRMILIAEDMPAEKAVAEITEVEIDPFQDITITGRAAYVYDTRQKKVLYAKNEEAQLSLASLSKVMTALVTTKTIKDNEVVLATVIGSTSPEHVTVKRERWNVKKLLDYTLLVSSNEGAVALARSAGREVPVATLSGQSITGDESGDFVSEMNRTARELGLTQTYYLNPSGLDVSESVAGAYGSAKDAALLFAHVLLNHPHILEATAYQSLLFSTLDGEIRSAENTNPDAEKILGLMASKTGYTDLAGGNLIVAVDVGLGHPVIAVVLGSTKEDRFTDIEKLISAARLSIGQGE